MEILNIKKTEYGIEGTARFNLFDKEIELVIDDTVNLEYANKCVSHMNNLSYDTITNLCEAALKYCFEFSDDVGIEVPEIREKRDILKYVYLNILIINEAEDERKIAFHMECDCQWEIEHGLEFTLLDGDLLYLGSFNDESPWSSNEYFRNLSWNHVFKEADIYDDVLKNELLNLLK